MAREEQWIWLPREQYPERQKTTFCVCEDPAVGNYTVAEFQRRYEFDEVPVSVKLRFSGDTLFQLYCNGQVLATGPAAVGGDFIGNDTPRKNFYAFETKIKPEDRFLDFFARVQMMPVQICEYSLGQGGFMLSATVSFADGTEQILQSDESWLSRRNGAYAAPLSFDGRIAADSLVPAEVIENLWHTETAPIPIREERELFAKGCEIALAPFEEKELVLDYDRIYAGFLRAKSEGEGVVELCLTAREIDEEGSSERIVLDGNCDYRGFYMHSVGNIKAVLKNLSSKPARVTLSVISTHYPVCDEARTVTDDGDLNRVIDVCKHTLKICRQTHHLDSPRHCEPMACTGDYYIESLMTPFAFGDMRLAEFDLMRTAVLLERENGRMFHTTYSLIFVRMLYDVYMLTGKTELLRRCETALRLLLKRFETYIGESRLIENPPDYMFVDWIYIDGFTMHHPPKALGQTCLNMFYFGALDTAEKILRLLGDEEAAEDCGRRRESLRLAINSLLFDPKRGIYFEGLNTPEAEDRLSWALPQNTEKRYYLKHSNVLAAYFGVCDDDVARELIGKVMRDEIEGDIQPYFTHYLFEAVLRLGLREKYTLKLARRWKQPAKECQKGLVEGFVAPEPTYRFDHSHAWGGTPLYSLPRALLGLEILEPGMKRLRLQPSLLGLGSADVELLTPYGKVKVTLQRGSAPAISHPEEIEILTD